MCGYLLGLCNRNVQFPARKGTAKTWGQTTLAIRIQAAPCCASDPTSGVGSCVSHCGSSTGAPRDRGDTCTHVLWGLPASNYLTPPSNETTFLVSGRSLPFSLLFHSHRAENGNRQELESLANTVLRGQPKLTKKPRK